MKLSITAEGKSIAYRHASETNWNDPHGGVFTPTEQAVLSAFATGATDSVTLHPGTRWERVLYPRLVAR